MEAKCSTWCCHLIMIWQLYKYWKYYCTRLPADIVCGGDPISFISSDPEPKSRATDSGSAEIDSVIREGKRNWQKLSVEPARSDSNCQDLAAVSGNCRESSSNCQSFLWGALVSEWNVSIGKIRHYGKQMHKKCSKAGGILVKSW